MKAEWFKELAEYLKITPEQCVEHMKAIDINQQWLDRRSDIQFYQDADFYLYDLTNYACDKNRIAYTDELKQFVKKKELKTGLDYGCGIGTDVIAMLEAKMTEVWGLDIHSKCSDYLHWRLINDDFKYMTNFRHKFNFLDIDEELPKVDIAICVAVLEHVPNPEQVLRKLVDCCDYLVLRVDPTNPNGAHPMHIEKNFPFLIDVDGHKPELMEEYGLKRNYGIKQMPLFEIIK